MIRFACPLCSKPMTALEGEVGKVIACLTCGHLANVPAALSVPAAGTIALHDRLRTWSRTVDRFVALSEFAADRLVRGGLPSDRIELKPNFVADPGPRAAPAAASATVLYVGRLSSEKGVELLVEAWRQLGDGPLELVVVGDGHGVQGNGEVGLSAMETSLRGEIQVVVHKGMRTLWPRAETPTHYMTMGLHQDLNEAARIATREMLNFIVATKRLPRDDVYMLLSAAMDLHVTQVVDGTKGVHAMIAKSIFRK